MNFHIPAHEHYSLNLMSYKDLCNLDSEGIMSMHVYYFQYVDRNDKPYNKIPEKNRFALSHGLLLCKKMENGEPLSKLTTNSKLTIFAHGSEDNIRWNEENIDSEELANRLVSYGLRAFFCIKFITCTLGIKNFLRDFRNALIRDLGYGNIGYVKGYMGKVRVFPWFKHCFIYTIQKESNENNVISDKEVKIMDRNLSEINQRVKIVPGFFDSWYLNCIEDQTMLY